ncbi:hypothetical protein HO173_002431 [Letharia columbiana]|uniref:Uncharacterized protein n=1 Tax=Letharia columbiana TaxID=112416 RepID=A0A8H6G3X4_9LECA|nr:uncharacterized protein HO173_002431 [Letharia columbiana]KAF6239884.1 hypothetical protein HO173_002431 [Letharia columbiana]
MGPLCDQSACYLAKGNFKQDIPSLRLDFNTTSDIAGDPAPVFVVEDNFGDCEQ